MTQAQLFHTPAARPRAAAPPDRLRALKLRDGYVPADGRDPVDFTPRLRCGDTVRCPGQGGEGPIHGFRYHSTLNVWDVQILDAELGPVWRPLDRCELVASGPGWRD